MDALETVDWGAYYHFRYLAGQHPQLLPAAELVNSLTHHAVLGVLIVFTLLALWLYGRPRTAVVGLATFLAGIVVAEGLRGLIARRRPDDAENLLGPDGMVGSFPAVGVLLFTLTALLLTFALWETGLGRTGRVLSTAAAAVLIVAVCLSQFFLGLHFVTDVVAGLLGGLVFALLARQLSVAGEAPKASV